MCKSGAKSGFPPYPTICGIQDEAKKCMKITIEVMAQVSRCSSKKIINITPNED